jgi:hypothetical protein
VTFGVALTLLSGGRQAAAHEIVGVQSYNRCQPTLARAFLRSPNPGTGNRDYPLVVIDASGDPTGEYVVVMTLQNQSDFDARATAVGFAWPEPASRFDLIQLYRPYNELTTNTNGTRTGAIGPNDYAVVPSFTISQSQNDMAFSTDRNVHGVPGFPHTVLSFALVTGRTFSGGNPNEGLASDAVRHQIAFKGMLSTGAGLPQIEDLLNDAYVRFRRVGVDGEGSETGIWRNLLPPISCGTTTR